MSFLASKETVKKRREICAQCPHLGKTLGVYRCNKCGCPIVSKTRVQSTSCPIGKW